MKCEYVTSDTSVIIIILLLCRPLKRVMLMSYYCMCLCNLIAIVATYYSKTLLKHKRYTNNQCSVVYYNIMNHYRS